MDRRLPSALAAAAVTLAGVLLAGSSPAAGTLPALPGEQQILVAAKSSARLCHAARATGQPGVATISHRAPALQALTVRTDAGSVGDWDLAVFDATGRRLAASATATTRERVTVLLRAGQRVDVQACRLRGAHRLRVGLDQYAIATSAADVLTTGTGSVQMVRVTLGSPADVGRLERLGLDVTHNSVGQDVDVVVYGDRQMAKLRATGLAYRVRIADLPAADARAQRRDAARTRSSLRAAGFRALPSGRTTYRNYEDYGADLKKLAADHPGHVRSLSLGLSLEGRPIEGLEIAAGVGRPDDGRPIFVLAGNTHAREWPSGENSIEFAIDIARSFAAGGDARVRSLLQRVRVFVFPMLNPDGFVVSREAGALAGQDGGDDTPSPNPDAVIDRGAYKRKNCRADTPDTQATPCALRAPYGVDLNRAYGAYWGGAGSSSDSTSQGYRGPAPFTEPEAIAVRAFGASHQIQTFVTNHTFTDVGRWLRQPGFQIEGDDVADTTPDEVRMKALGDAMADSTGYVSELGYVTLGNITGPSDDHLYYSQGTYGYTPELRGENFHTGYADAVIGEYSGEGDKVGRGLREAYIVAGEFAADPQDHGILRGSAPAGSVLRLKKTTMLKTSEDEDGDGTKDKPAIAVPETFDGTLRVGSSGRYEWHVNPSTRPLAPAPESFTFTCEVAGSVRQTHHVTIGRGQALAFDFGSCGPVAAAPLAVVTRASLGRARLSARRVNRARRASIAVRLRSGALRTVRVRIVQADGRVAMLGTVAALRRTANVRLRLVRRLRAGGSYRVVLTARGSDGRAVRLTKKLRVTR